MLLQGKISIVGIELFFLNFIFDFLVVFQVLEVLNLQNETS